MTGVDNGHPVQGTVRKAAVKDGRGGLEAQTNKQTNKGALTHTPVSQTRTYFK